MNITKRDRPSYILSFLFLNYLLLPKEIIH